MGSTEDARPEPADQTPALRVSANEVNPPLPPRRGSRQYKYFDLVMAAFVAVLLCSNLIGPAKVCNVGGVTFGAGNLFFPLSYIFGDILTEVYGYARSRRVIWAGFAAMVFATVMSQVVLRMPAHLADPFQQAYEPAIELVFGGTGRHVAASRVAFWMGEFVNSFGRAKMKVATEGRWLWMRTIGSTVVGQAVDSVIFYPLAFGGVWSNATLVKVLVANYLLKCAWEALNTPITYLIVNRLKRVEHEDYYDIDTDFSPFKLGD